MSQGAQLQVLLKAESGTAGSAAASFWRLLAGLRLQGPPEGLCAR